MRQIFPTIVVLSAALSLGGVSRATTIDYDVHGIPNNNVTDINSVNTVSSFAPNPPGFFTNGFGAGSTIQVDIEGSNVTLNSATFYIVGATPLGFLGEIDTDVVSTYAGGTGTLTGYNTILWNTPTTLASTGTFSCQGSICDLFQLTAGQAYPIALLTQLTGVTPLTSIDLGTWYLSADLGTILTSTQEVIALGGASPPPGPGLPAQWFQLGRVAPEPGTLLLVLLGFGGLALRRRTA